MGFNLAPRLAASPLVSFLRSTTVMIAMRIPTQLNDDNLYRRGGKRPRPVDAYRRVIRMCLALVLVFVVMNAASQKAIYEPFFAPQETAEAISLPESAEPVPQSTAIMPPVSADETIAVEAQSRVVDGTVWRASDRDAIRLRLQYWNQSSGDDANQGVAAGVLPLLQQPDVFRGQIVRMRGKVARCEKIDATDRLPEYWQLWIRPDDGADRPFVALVSKVPANIAGIAADASLEDGPPVSVQGHFVKRLAYRSGVGADLAPAIVGKLHDAPASIVRAGTTAASEPRLVTPGILIGLATAIGVLLAGLIMWRTKTLAAQTRALRDRHRSASLDLPSDLSALENENP